MTSDPVSPRPLSNLATYINGRAFKPSDFTANGLPVIRIRQLLDPDEPCDRYEGPYSDRNYIDDGDLIFSWSATLAAVVWRRGPALLNQHLFKVVEAPGIEREWLALALQFLIPQMQTMVHGSTMRHITRATLDEVHVDVPSVVEQRRTIDLMAAFDDHQARLAALMEVGGRARAALLADLVSGRRGVPPSYDRFLRFE